MGICTMILQPSFVGYDPCKVMEIISFLNDVDYLVCVISVCTAFLNITSQQFLKIQYSRVRAEVLVHYSTLLHIQRAIDAAYLDGVLDERLGENCIIWKIEKERNKIIQVVFYYDVNFRG